ncbi:MAG: hypothetical protein P4L45_00475 [Ignavibacteriaceae bacterium]|nr:hypothetical protein [Ignavibacteriaceae bacterium]
MLIKYYLISDIKFRLKTDLTLDEAEEVQELFKNLFLQGGQADEQSGLVTGTFTNAEIKKFLSIALEPTDVSNNAGKKFIEEFDFGRAKETVAIEIIRDFFLHRIKKYQDFTLSCADSIKQPSR